LTFSKCKRHKGKERRFEKLGGGGEDLEDCVSLFFISFFSEWKFDDI